MIAVNELESRDGMPRPDVGLRALGRGAGCRDREPVGVVVAAHPVVAESRCEDQSWRFDGARRDHDLVGTDDAWNGSRAVSMMTVTPEAVPRPSWSMDRPPGRG